MSQKQNQWKADGQGRSLTFPSKTCCNRPDQRIEASLQVPFIKQCLCQCSHRGSVPLLRRKLESPSHIYRFCNLLVINVDLYNKKNKHSKKMDTRIIKYYLYIWQSFERVLSAFSFCCEISSLFSVFLNFLGFDDICKKNGAMKRTRKFCPMKALYTTRKQENMYKPAKIRSFAKVKGSYWFRLLLLWLLILLLL